MTTEVTRVESYPHFSLPFFLGTISLSILKPRTNILFGKIKF